MVKLVLGFYLYLAGKCCENLQKAKGPRNVNPARAITWLLGVINYCTIFQNNSPQSCQFFRKKNLLEKKLGKVEMLFEQIIEFELKQKFLKKILWWIIIYCWNIVRGNAPYFILTGTNPLQNLTPKYKILNVFWT